MPAAFPIRADKVRFMSRTGHRQWRRIVDTVRSRRGPCCICGQPINYTLPPTHRQAFTTAHYVSVNANPGLALDPTNVKGPAHRACNSSEGDDIVHPNDSHGGASHNW